MKILKIELVFMIDLVSSVEAVLFASGEAVPVARLSLVLGVGEEEILEAADELDLLLQRDGHALRVLRLGEKLQMCSAPDYSQIISRVMEHRKPPMLSPSSLEALAIVAYFQPVTNAYISKVRGVDSSYTVSSLVDKGLIEVKGKLDVPGRPSLYGTTDAFLRTMGIKDLRELPPVPDMTNVEGISQLQKKIDDLKAENEQLLIGEFEHKE